MIWSDKFDVLEKLPFFCLSVLLSVSLLSRTDLWNIEIILNGRYIYSLISIYQKCRYRAFLLKSIVKGKIKYQKYNTKLIKANENQQTINKV